MGAKALKLNLIRHCSVRAKLFFDNFFGGNFYLTYLIKLLSNHFFISRYRGLTEKKKSLKTFDSPYFSSV